MQPHMVKESFDVEVTDKWNSLQQEHWCSGDSFLEEAARSFVAY